MDMKSWPWRKKSSEKILCLNDSAEASPTHFMRHLDDQAIPTDQMGLRMEEETAHVYQSEAQFQQLKERLSVALLDASAKDELIKQHAKVAEEAVSGWEKAESEAIASKQELDSIMQQKLATEDRVSHLDGALKECMWQLRQAREEQEEKIHSATVKSSREWERIHAQLEEKLLDMEQKYLDKDAENRAISKLLQEREVTISEISEARSRTEANLNVLQIRLESMERAQSALKFELSASKEELESKNEEKFVRRRFTEAASRHHVEDPKKIAKLEGECQRLRGGLVRKKLPAGYGASVQIKCETENLKDKNDINRKKIASLKEKREDKGPQKLKGATPSGGKDMNALLDRLGAMEDETRRLKELLTRKDNELQHARLMCARTASKLSSVEQQLETLSHDQGLQRIAGMSALDKHVEAARSLTVSCEPSVASVSEDGNDDCSEAWASALIAELAQFKVEKGTSCLQLPKVQSDNNTKMDPPISSEGDEGAKSFEHTIIQKVAENHAAQLLCEQPGDKLRGTENKVATLQRQNAVTQLGLQALQDQLDTILQAQDDGKNMEVVLNQVREAMGIPQVIKNEKETAPNINLLEVGPHCTSTVCQAKPSVLHGHNFISSESCEVGEEATNAGGHDGNASTPELDKDLLLEVTKLEEDLRKAQGEKVALETHVQMEFQRFHGLVDEVGLLRGDKVELEHLVEVAKGELDRLKSKLQRAEQAESSLQEELTSSKLFTELMEEQLLTLNIARAEAESQLSVIETIRDDLQGRISVLERDCLDKETEIAGLRLECQELRTQLPKEPELVCSKCSLINNDGHKESKEQEIAAKLAECQQTILLLGKQFTTLTSSKEHFDQAGDPSAHWSASPEEHSLLTHHDVDSEFSEKKCQPKSLMEVTSGTPARRKNRMRGHAKKEIVWETHRDSNASDTLDSELISLSKSGRPLLELFGDKTPAHEHYIQALEQLTSSSEEEFAVPKRVEVPVMAVESTMKWAPNRKTAQRRYAGVDVSRSMDDTGSEKHNSTLSRLFSRVKNS